MSTSARRPMCLLTEKPPSYVRGKTFRWAAMQMRAVLGTHCSNIHPSIHRIVHWNLAHVARSTTMYEYVLSIRDPFNWAALPP